MFLPETIAAISTPLGNGGLAVIRLSGPAACQIAELVFEPLGKDSRPPSQARTHTIHYGRIVRATEAIDEVLLAVMRAPKSFTREDVVEISSHGGILPAKLILDLLLEKGARLAEPGEFTKRAFLNGRIDLAQAEAVVDIIHSRTELALAAANEQLAGKLSRRINQLRDELMITLAHVEAHIDFPDEDIAPATRDQLLAQLGRALVFMDDLLKTADEGKILRHGIYAAIVGRPNVGKSSLLNQLLGRDRAIVSPVAGTTRDTIEETANIRGVPVVFVDTAGIRESMDQVEVEGIRRTQASLKKAELILQVCDISEPWTSADQKLLDDFVHKKQIVVFNKSDLPHAPKPSPKLAPPAVEVSCFTGAGIEPLKGAIKALVWSGEVGSGVVPVMINSRHQDALRRGSEATKKAEEGLISELTLELVALDLRIAVSAIGEIVGKTSTEDLLDSIFSQFCIGK